jgi:hypothetical protein
MLTTERADRRQARHEPEVAAYHDPQTKFERREDAQPPLTWANTTVVDAPVETVLPA